ncbi:hypothetical protein LBMAG27_07590 [Bacteroidota bacterium]|nr:hypothetical protein LBMAG27_07590 [Bacteroidota bacterium]
MQMQKSILKIFIITISIAMYCSCTHDSLVKPKEVSFKNDVLLVIAGNCQTSGCHGATGFSNFPLVTYEDVINNGDVESGKPNSSKIYKSINGQTGDLMPPSGVLSAVQIQIVHDWIEQGAKNN